MRNTEKATGNIQILRAGMNCDKGTRRKIKVEEEFEWFVEKNRRKGEHVVLLIRTMLGGYRNQILSGHKR